MLLSLLWFDLAWCGFTSFKPFTDYVSLYIFLPAVAGLLALPAALTRRWWVGGAIITVLNIFQVANLMYARSYFVPIPLESYGLLGNLAGFEGAVADSLRWIDMGFLVITAGACWGGFRLGSKTPPMRGRFMAGYLVLVGILCGLAYGSLAVRGGFGKRFEMFSNAAGGQQIPAPVYTLFSTLLYDYMTLGKELTPVERNETMRWLDEHNALTAKYIPQALADSLGASSVAVILCESLESWPIGLSVEGHDLTPWLNSLVADSAVYYNPNVVTQVKDGRSIDAQLLYIAGQMPLASGAYCMKYSSGPYETVAHAMKRRGAATYLFSSDKATTWNQGPVACSMGFDRLMTAPDWVPDADEIDDDALLFRRSIEAMENGKVWPVGERAFAMWVTHSGHVPFDFVSNRSSLPLTGDYPVTLSNFMKTANYVDSSLRILVEYLRSRPDGDSIAIVIVGDHEGLASQRNELSQAFSWVDSRGHTPLIIVNSCYSGHDTKEIGQVDVYSALLDVVGVYGSWSWRGQGQSPFDPAHPGAAVASDGRVFPPESPAASHLRQSYVVGDRLLRYGLPRH